MQKEVLRRGLAGMRQYQFWLVLAVITLGGVALRLVDYDRIPPFDHTMDEFFYPWAGMSWLTDGVPRSWAWWHTYTDVYKTSLWGHSLEFAAPWLEKPPLYSLLMGGYVLALGAEAFADVQTAAIRLVPIIASVFTIYLVGLLGRSLWNESVGVVAALLYAAVPTVVLANRLSLTENMLTPLMLAAALLLSHHGSRRATYYLLIAVSGLAVLVKNTGVVVPLVASMVYVARREWVPAIGVAAMSTLFLVVQPLLGWLYGWETFWGVMQEYQAAHAGGLPQMVYSIFVHPMVANRNQPLLEEALLMGYILLFAAPWWVAMRETKQARQRLWFLLMPLTYIALLGYMETAHPASNFYGWHLYPLFPFVLILLAVVLTESWRQGRWLKIAVVYALLGSSALRYMLYLFPEWRSHWQWGVAGLYVLLGSGLLLRSKAGRERWSIACLGVLVAVYAAAVIQAEAFYPSRSQPVQVELSESP